MDTEPIQKTAGLIADYGILIVIGSLFVIAAGSAIFLVIRYWNKKISGEYVKKSEILEWLKENNPSILRQDHSSLPDLRNHKFFNEANRQIRAAENSSSSNLERDLIAWTIRGYRDVFATILGNAYESKEGFDAVIGDATKFRSSIDSALVESSSDTKYRLVVDFEFPAAVYSKWLKSRELSDELMTNMLDIATERQTPYDRLQCALDSQYARVLMLRKSVEDFVGTIPQEQIEAYKPPTEAEHNTYHDSMSKNRRKK